VTVQDAASRSPVAPPVRVSDPAAVALGPVAETHPGATAWTPPTAKSPDELFDAIADRHGGRSRLSVADIEVVTNMVRVFDAMRRAAPADLPRLVDSLAKLEGMLPGSQQRSLSPLDRLRDHCATHGVPS